MFFVISKLFWFVMQPSSLMLLALAFGLLRLVQGRDTSGRRWLWGGMLALLIGGLTPIDHLLYAPLENRFPRAEIARGDVAGIIVLGGAGDAYGHPERELMPLGEAGERMTEAVALARRLPNARLVFSGGSGGLLRTEEAEAAEAGRLFVALGIDPARITLEDKSRTTAENARFSKAIVQPKPGERWILITSAWHMPRAIGSFRAVGFPVEAWPVDYRTSLLNEPPRLYGDVSEGLYRLDFVAKEYAGLLGYWLTGRSSALLPGP